VYVTVFLIASEVQNFWEYTYDPDTILDGLTILSVHVCTGVITYLNALILFNL